MPTPEENMQSVRTFAEEVFGNNNLKYADDWLSNDFVEHQVFPGTTPDKKGAIDSYRIFFAASPDMMADSRHGGGGRQGCDQSHIPRHRHRRIHPQHAGYRKGFRNGGHISSGSTTRVRSPSTGVSSTRLERWVSSACFRPHHERSLRLRLWPGALDLDDQPLSTRPAPARAG